MIASTLVALALATAPIADDEGWQQPYEEEEEDDRPRLFLSAWGGEAFDSGGDGESAGFLGGEVAWAFDAIDVGLAGYGYRDHPESTRAWTPVALLRLTQRFRTRQGVEAAFSFGAGAGRPDDWEAWFQVALGLRVGLGPLFLGGELAFEQFDMLRLGAGLGVAF